MSIIRHHSTYYGVIPSSTANDENLTAEALGVLSYLLSKPQTWEVRIGDVRKRFGIGNDKMRRIMRELVDAGYARLIERRGENGRLAGTFYEISDRPIFQPGEPASTESGISRSSGNLRLGEPGPLGNKRDKENLDIGKSSQSLPKAEKVDDEPKERDRIRFDADRLKEMLTSLLRESGQEGNQSLTLNTISPIMQLLAEGYDFDRDVLPAARKIRERGKTFRSWKYLAAVVREMKRERIAAGDACMPLKDWEWHLIIEHARRTGAWYWDAWGPPPHIDGFRGPDLYRGQDLAIDVYRNGPFWTGKLETEDDWRAAFEADLKYRLPVNCRMRAEKGSVNNAEKNA